MLDSHVDKTLHKKILAFEYVDFGKLLPKVRQVKEEEGQRLEIVNRNGISFLSPVADRETTAVSHYNKWEQAFRIYSNIITTKYPLEATELLGYSHVIHSVASAYVWDNVYSYDREFCRHIALFPTRPWNVILQQAWTMLLKDRLKSEGVSSHHKSKQGKINEPCRRYNKGKCTFGLSCCYEHRCTIKKCRKFGHGAHICRLRQGNQESDNKSLPSRD